MSDDDLSDLSSLSSLSPPPPDIDDEVELKEDKQGIMKYFTKVRPEDAAASRKSPPPRKREPSPPHEPVFADSPDIAVSKNRAQVAFRREGRGARRGPRLQPRLTHKHSVHRHVSQALRQRNA